MATHQNAHQHISMPINIVTEAIEKENTRYQRKLKNSCIGYFCRCIKTDAFEDEKVEYYKICSVPQRKTTNYIPTLVKSFVIRFPTSSCRKTLVNV